MPLSDLDRVLASLDRLLEALSPRGGSDPQSRLEVSETQARILRQLDHRDPAMVGELAEFMGVTPSTMSLNLKRLEEAGCVTRSRDPDDRRVMNVLLTATGRRIKEASAVVEPGRLRRLLDALRPDERSRVVEGITLLASAVDRTGARTDAYVTALTGPEGS